MPLAIIAKPKIVFYLHGIDTFSDLHTSYTFKVVLIPNVLYQYVAGLDPLYKSGYYSDIPP